MLALAFFDCVTIENYAPAVARAKLPYLGEPGAILAMRFKNEKGELFRGTKYTTKALKNAILVDIEIETKRVCLHFHKDKIIVSGAKSPDHHDQAAGYITDHINLMYDRIQALQNHELRDQAVEWIHRNKFQIVNVTYDDGTELESLEITNEQLPPEYEFCEFLFNGQNDLDAYTILESIDDALKVEIPSEPIKWLPPTITMMNKVTSIGHSVNCQSLSVFASNYTETMSDLKVYYDAENSPEYIHIYWTCDPDEYGVKPKKDGNFVSFTINSGGAMSFSGPSEEAIIDAYNDIYLLLDDFFASGENDD